MRSVLVSLASELDASAGVHVSRGAIGITFGRATALVALAVGLISVVLGVLCRRAAGLDASAARGRALSSLGTGLFGMVLSGVHLASASGPIGTGSGRLGAMVAMLVGLSGAILGGLALSRARRIT